MGPASVSTRPRARASGLASLCALLLGAPAALAQSRVEEFRLGGSAQVLSEDCIRLTPDQPGVSGSAWFERPVELARPFEVRLSVVLGEKDEQGADGIVFVLHPTPETGWRGEGMGFAGLEPSLGIEIDTYRNVHLGDPQADHLAVMSNGGRWHGPGEAPPVPVPNLEDGRRHPLRVTWDGARLEVYLDGALRVTVPGRLVLETFGPGKVYWGLTAGTGRLSNAQDVCLERELLTGPAPRHSWVSPRRA